MASITIPNLPEELRRTLEEAAKKEGRSVDEQVVAILDRVLRPVPPVSLPVPIQPLRPITTEEIASGIREGRE